MKHYIQIFLLLVMLLCLTTCALFGPKTGTLEGIEIYMAMSVAARSRSTDYTFPDNVKIAFTKIWFPSVDSFNTLKAANPDHHEGIIFINKTSDFSDLTFYKALTRDDDNPYIFDASSTDPFEPETPPGYGQTFYGVFLETLYFEMVMPTYSIRWYQRDSGSYKQQDILINNGSGWEFVYLQRTIEFDFLNMENKVDNVSTLDIRLITSSTRDVVGSVYFENWYNSGTVTSGTVIGNDYVWAALGVYDLREGYIAQFPDDLTNETLVQYFGLAGDVPNDSHPTNDYIGLQCYDGPWNDTGGLCDCPLVTVGYGPDAYDLPPSSTSFCKITTFAEDNNEAQLYKMEIEFDFARYLPDETAACGLGIDSVVTPPAATWTGISGFNNFFTMTPITGGISIKFGWLDFNDAWQGDFSPDAGS